MLFMPAAPGRTQAAVPAADMQDSCGCTSRPYRLLRTAYDMVHPTAAASRAHAATPAGRRPRATARRALALPALAMLALATLLTALPARADPGYYLVAPYDHAGQLTAEFRYWTFTHRGAAQVIWPELGVSYGVNTRWTTGLLESYIGHGWSDLKASTLTWQNVVLLTQGEWPLDVALWGALSHAQNGLFKNAVEWGPVLQTDIGRTQLNANLFFEHTYGAPRPKPTQMKYQWQVKHRWRPGWQVGLQGFGELGDWDGWAPADRQSHRLGPALFAGVRDLAGGEWALQAAYLSGKTYGTTGSMWSLRAAYSY